MIRKTVLLVAVVLPLAGCEFGLRGYSGPDSVIATAWDHGRDSGVLANGRAAIAYDPDGCQNWLIDDGIEGYSSPRYDPVSGLPICNSLHPPGTVLGNYQTETAGIRDRVPTTRGGGARVGAP